ncbi:MAG: pyruvate dehydrogenase complex dihydrolipoamide acetyltransferase [Chitinophagaceae bacterium]|nr:pyruvate dehydrogenase complex dihydrolipoamide acetyltransferase [Chitinophagaceae bacterium]
MAEVIRMPRMSDTMTEGVIVEWHKKVGDKVKPGDLLAEVETDKATMELESYNEGTLLYLGVEKGKSVQVDGILAVVGKEGEDFKSALGADQVKEVAVKDPVQTAENSVQPGVGSGQPAKVSLPDGAKEIRMPLLSDTMTEGKIIAWHKKIGDFVKSDDVLAEVETDKATMDVVGYEEGTLLYIGVEAGHAARINEIIAIVGKAGTDVSAYVAAEKAGTNAQPAAAAVAGAAAEATGSGQAALVNAPVVASEESTGDQRVKASPLAKKIAAEKGIDISKVAGSGDGGRVTKKDIDDYKTPTAGATPVGGMAKTASVAGEEGFTDIPLTQMRKTIARRLGESKFSAPHFYLTMEINMDNAMSVRTQLNELSPVKISFNDLIIKSVALSLRQHPPVNSSWMSARPGTDGNDFIRQNHHIHIGSAVATPDGLIVPVIRFADQKTLSQIAIEAKELYGKAKDKKLQPAEFSGNTFTISNLGMMDIEEFTAIINPPDSAILAVGRIREIVVKKGEGFGVTNVMKLTLSCDHRSVDGAVGAAFLQTLKKYLENPVNMLI